MTEDELKKFREEERLVRLIQSGRNALIRRSPVGAAAAGLRETYSQAGKELTEASRQPSFIGRTGAAAGALARMPGRFIGTTAADMYGTAERAYGAGADTLGRFGRALVTGSEATGSEAETPAAVTRTPAVSPPAPNMADTARSEARRAMAEEYDQTAAVPDRNVITDAQGNRTFIDDETGNVRTVSATGQEITGQRRMPGAANVQGQEQGGDILYPQSAGVKRTWVNAAPISPDYGFGQQRETPQRLTDLASPDVTIGEAIARKPLLRAAAQDQRADFERESMAQRAASENMDRLFKAADMAQRDRSEAVDYDLRRQQLAQQGTYQQGELGLRKEELAAKKSESNRQRSAEAARQARLDAALTIFDDPSAPPEIKKRAQRIIEASRGQASFDLGEKPMTQDAAQKSLQDTWRAVAGNDAPLDPVSVEQLQSVAQANPSAWKAVYGGSTPDQVQKFNTMSRQTDDSLLSDPLISSGLKKAGKPLTPENARIMLEKMKELARGR